MTADRAPRAAVGVLGELIEDSTFMHGGRIDTLAAIRVAEDVIAAGWTPPRPAPPAAPEDQILDVLYGRGRKPGGAA